MHEQKKPPGLARQIVREIRRLRTKCDELQERVTALEEELANRPTEDAIQCMINQGPDKYGRG